MMDVTTDDAIGIFTPRLIGDHALELADEIDRMLDLQFLERNLALIEGAERLAAVEHCEAVSNRVGVANIVRDEDDGGGVAIDGIHHDGVDAVRHEVLIIACFSSEGDNSQGARVLPPAPGDLDVRRGQFFACSVKSQVND